MNDENRFKPPEAALDPSVVARPSSRVPGAVLALVGMLQLAWLGVWAPRCLQLVGEGQMNPVGPFLCTLGCVCLYAGLLRALPDGRRGRNLFLAALVLLMVGLRLLGAHHVFAALLALMPFALACLVAALGLALTWMRARGQAA